jgi:hypothetical protein
LRLFRREFRRGMVLVKEPGSPVTTVDLGGTYKRLDGTLATQVTVNAGDGVVLLAP